MSKQYRRILLGKRGISLEDGLKGGWIGAGFLNDVDLTGKFPEEWREFNKQYIPRYLEQNPEKTKISAGLACGMLHAVCKGTRVGDIVLTPDSEGLYHFGEITGGYFYDPSYPSLPHKRPVKWYDLTIHRNDFSEALRRSAGSIGTVSNVTRHAEEIEKLLGHVALPVLTTNDETVEDPSVFALEKHLEDFLVANWEQTALGKTHDIYEEDGELIGQQYPSDTGPIDILAISKDRKEILVVELKKGRASDSVVGQVQRYMGYVLTELAEPEQTVRGVIIALEQDKRIEQALKVAPNINFYRYQVSFELRKS